MPGRSRSPDRRAVARIPQPSVFSGLDVTSRFGGLPQRTIRELSEYVKSLIPSKEEFFVLGMTGLKDVIAVAVLKRFVEENTAAYLTDATLELWATVTSAGGSVTDRATEAFMIKQYGNKSGYAATYLASTLGQVIFNNLTTGKKLLAGGAIGAAALAAVVPAYNSGWLKEKVEDQMMWNMVTSPEFWSFLGTAMLSFVPIFTTLSTFVANWWNAKDRAFIRQIFGALVYYVTLVVAWDCLSLWMTPDAERDTGGMSDFQTAVTQSADVFVASLYVSPKARSFVNLASLGLESASLPPRLLSGTLEPAISEEDGTRGVAIENARTVAKRKISAIKRDDLFQFGLARVTDVAKRGNLASPTNDDVNALINDLWAKLGNRGADVSTGDYNGWRFLSRDIMARVSNVLLGNEDVAGIAVNVDLVDAPWKPIGLVVVPVKDGNGLVVDPDEAETLSRQIFGDVTDRGQPSALAEWRWNLRAAEAETVGEALASNEIKGPGALLEDLFSKEKKYVGPLAGTWDIIKKCTTWALLRYLARALLCPNDESLESVRGDRIQIVRITQIPQSRYIPQDGSKNYNLLLATAWNSLMDAWRADPDFEAYLLGHIDPRPERVEEEVQMLTTFIQGSMQAQDDKVSRLLDTNELSKGDGSLRAIRMILFHLIPTETRGLLNHKCMQLFDKLRWVLPLGMCEFCPSNGRPNPKPDTPLIWWSNGDPASKDSGFTFHVWPPAAASNKEEYKVLFNRAQTAHDVAKLEQSCLSCYCDEARKKITASELKTDRKSELNRFVAQQSDFVHEMNADWLVNRLLVESRREPNASSLELVRLGQEPL